MEIDKKLEIKWIIENRRCKVLIEKSWPSWMASRVVRERREVDNELETQNTSEWAIGDATGACN